ncbi:subtilisin-like protease SBT3.3 [Senna tora]|uniref:Subtilisin-like protease SBT3.3 n=1 Tax=Senna tora TaxID=362788 RepID=A0A834WP54_9FABA|nr:subtilisin-like protease SBT3.3 [Senna tora]
MLPFILPFFLLVLQNINILPTAAVSRSNVYIVYMGMQQHDEPDSLTELHHETLKSVIGREESSDSMVYSYKHGFSGFAAKLTETQAKMVQELPNVIRVIPNHLYKMQTTRSWDYLQLPLQSFNGLLHQAKMGDGVIIGLLDSGYNPYTFLLYMNMQNPATPCDKIATNVWAGIWPESKAFSDEGMGPIPSRWRGVCESGEHFNATKNCNRKLIGARYFIKGILAEYGDPLNSTIFLDFLSPRDGSQHGTHTSSTAAGSFITDASYSGLGVGTVRGGAPQARLAMYKVCWSLYIGGVCAAADLLKAFDEAIHDGVDVLSMSIGSDLPLYSDIDVHNGITIGAFHAVANGISVICSAGNQGPDAQTVQSPAPWLLTVAASTVDRSFPTPITLGNNWTTLGQGMFTGKDTGFITLVYPEVSEFLNPRHCGSLSPNDTWVSGNVVLCFIFGYQYSGIQDAAWTVREAGALGIIAATNPSTSPDSCGSNFPCVQVSHEIGMQMLYYIRSTRSPTVRISPSKTHIGRPVSTSIAEFSSRGPSPIAPAILKPDIAAPGVNILAAVAPGKRSVAFMSGTSMSAPHVSGVVALLKSLHPNWSPAALKSAIMTTAWTTDPSGEPIFVEGEPMKLADPFDFGSGIVNPNRAADPGLVYDMDVADYVQYLCAMGYSNPIISHQTGLPISCPAKRPSMLDINLPSITIPSLRTSTTIVRTVTNVGPVNSLYKAVVEAPVGITLAVQPDTLVFNSTVKTITFTIVVSSSHHVSTGYLFGSLTWYDRKHAVRSPISVRTQITESYG